MKGLSRIAVLATLCIIIVGAVVAVAVYQQSAKTGGAELTASISHTPPEFPQASLLDRVPADASLVVQLIPANFDPLFQTLHDIATNFTETAAWKKINPKQLGQSLSPEEANRLQSELPWIFEDEQLEKKLEEARTIVQNVEELVFLIGGKGTFSIAGEEVIIPVPTLIAKFVSTEEASTWWSKLEQQIESAEPDKTFSISAEGEHRYRIRFGEENASFSGLIELQDEVIAASFGSNSIMTAGEGNSFSRTQEKSVHQRAVRKDYAALMYFDSEVLEQQIDTLFTGLEKLPGDDKKELKEINRLIKSQMTTAAASRLLTTTRFVRSGVETESCATGREGNRAFAAMQKYAATEHHSKLWKQLLQSETVLLLTVRGDLLPLALEGMQSKLRFAETTETSSAEIENRAQIEKVTDAAERLITGAKFSEAGFVVDMQAGGIMPEAGLVFSEVANTSAALKELKIFVDTVSDMPDLNVGFRIEDETEAPVPAVRFILESGQVVVAQEISSSTIAIGMQGSIFATLAARLSDTAAKNDAAVWISDALQKRLQHTDYLGAVNTQPLLIAAAPYMSLLQMLVAQSGVTAEELQELLEAFAFRLVSAQTSYTAGEKAVCSSTIVSAE